MQSVAQVPRRMLGEGRHEFGRHELRVAGRVERVSQPVEQFRRGQIVQGEADADAAGDGSMVSRAKALDEPVVAGEDDGEDGARVEVGRGQDAQFGEDRVGHLLRFVDEQDGAKAGGLDVGQPLLAQRLEAGPAVVRRERDAEEAADLAIEIAQAALRSQQDADLDVGQRGEVMGE